NAGSAPCDRMNFSAAASSSPVVTPGLTLPASRFIVRTRIVPAAAIRSISADVFLMIIGRSDVVFQTKCGDHRPDVIVNLVGAARSVDPPHQSLLVVVVD